MRNNRYILTPFFLDDALPQLEELYEDDWWVNNPHLKSSGKMTRMSRLHQGLSNLVERALEQNERPVSIAGDCCTTIGMLAGLQHAGISPYLIWFDAHGDFNTWETTPSGFLGGMPLAMIVGLGEQTLVNAVGMTPLPQEQVLLSDGRDLDPGERLAIKNSSITHLHHVGELLNYPLPEKPLYVHFDTDVLSPQVAPAMNYLAQGGASAQELQAVFNHLSQSGQIVAVSLSSWNPDLDTDGQSRNVCMELLSSLVSRS
jgi:arginase